VDDGSATPEIHTPVQPLNPANVIGVACSGHSLAVKGDGTVWAWGGNASGQVGDGSRNDRRIPVQLPPLSQVTIVAAGHEHSLALRTDGTVWAWGATGTAS
jgi:alpha-tubulin suppressor-like RCC1 family protein